MRAERSRTENSPENKWYLSRLVPVLSFVTSFLVLIGGASWLSAEPITIDGRSAGLVFLLIMIVCSLLWLLLTQLARLHQSRENLRLTIESTTDIVFLLDSEARYLEVFATSAAKLAAKPELIIGQTTRQVLGDELGGRIETVIADVLKTGRKQSLAYSLELSGETLWFEAVVSKRDSDTVVAMVRDVTREQLLTNELEEQRRFMENILNAISDPIFMKDEEHRWLYGNDAFCTILGKSREEYYGQTDSAFFPEDRANAFYSSDVETFEAMREVEKEESILVFGEVRTILTKKTPFVGRDGRKTLVGIIRDITDRKLMEKQLEEERARQIAASRLASLGEMAGGVAHEINNPLAIISGYAERLGDEIQRQPFEQKRALEIVRRIDMTAMRIASIVKGLRAISRDGAYDPKETVPLETIVSDTLGLCSERFRSQGVSIETKIEPSLVVNCRPVQISQVLLNLLTNAFFAVSKEPQSSIQVDASRAHMDSVEIAVTDSGVGVDPEIRDRIFEPFFTTKPAGVGTGLGLSIAASIIRDHGGELSLDPDTSRTRFVIRLPLSAEAL